MSAQFASTTPRARAYGLAFGALAPGRFNALTDVPGVRGGRQWGGTAITSPACPMSVRATLRAHGRGYTTHDVNDTTEGN